MCCRALGHHIQGDSHAEAVAELSKVDKRRAQDLRALLGMKTKAGYSSSPVNADQRKRAGRAAHRLVDATR